MHPTLQIALAICLQLVATSLNFIGMTIQKKAVEQIPPIASAKSKLRSSLVNIIKRKEWLFGYFLNGSSTLLTTIALALASISLIQPFYGFGLIVLVIFSRFYLQEKITTIDIIGILIGIVGIAVLGAFSSNTEVVSYSNLVSLFLGTSGVIFLSCSLFLALLFFILGEVFSSKISLVLLVISSTIWTALSIILMRMIALMIGDMGFLGALFGSSWFFFWSFVIGFIITAILGIILLNLAYQNGPSVLIIPIWVSIQVILPVLCGILIFKEWQSLDQMLIYGQISGIIIILSSTLILAINYGKKEDASQLLNKKELVDSLKIE
jgi:drug/metabolite transporter (DMT)-like permease